MGSPRTKPTTGREMEPGRTRVAVTDGVRGCPRYVCTRSATSSDIERYVVSLPPVTAMTPRGPTVMACSRLAPAGSPEFPLAISGRMPAHAHTTSPAVSFAPGK